MVPPQPLVRGANEKLIFGPGIPALWNVNNPNAPVKGKDVPAAKSSDQNADALPDALLFATWEYEPKNFAVTLDAVKKYKPHPPAWTDSDLPSKVNSRYQRQYTTTTHLNASMSWSTKSPWPRRR